MHDNHFIGAVPPGLRYDMARVDEAMRHCPPGSKLMCHSDGAAVVYPGGILPMDDWAACRVERGQDTPIDIIYHTKDDVLYFTPVVHRDAIVGFVVATGDTDGGCAVICHLVVLRDWEGEP